MKNPHPDPLITDYLRRLEVAASGLPPSQRADLVAEIREHIDAALLDAEHADEVTIRNVLERLGPPEEIAAAAGPVSRPRGTNGHAIAALIVLGLGFIVPVIGWLAGAGLVVTSDAWSSRDKLVGLLYGLISIPIIVMALTVVTGGSSLGAVELSLLVWGTGGVVSAVFLAWRLRQSQALLA
jgi:hypothetical protein